MAIAVLPLRTDLTHYDFTVTLDGVAYLFEFRWNGRDNAWYFDLRLPDGTDLILGVKVVVEWPIAKRCRDSRAPKGLLWALDSSGQRQDPGIADLGARVQIFYYDASELGNV